KGSRLVTFGWIGPVQASVYAARRQRHDSVTGTERTRKVCRLRAQSSHVSWGAPRCVAVGTCADPDVDVSQSALAFGAEPEGEPIPRNGRARLEGVGVQLDERLGWIERSVARGTSRKPQVRGAGASVPSRSEVNLEQI